MKKMKILLAALALVTCFGCGSKPEPKPLRVVTHITVTYEDSGAIERRFFNTEEKMQLLLHHIRSIGIRDTPDTDPETVTAPLIHITLAFSDGTYKVYTHKGSEYFREDNQPWKQISPEKTQGLYQLLMLMPGDEEAPHLLRPHPQHLPFFDDLPA